jgi:hypothetical protein
MKIPIIDVERLNRVRKLINRAAGLMEEDYNANLEEVEALGRQLGTLAGKTYDRNDNTLGVSVGGRTDWDTGNGREIVIKRDKMLDVREFLGYGEYTIWDEEESID